MECFGVEWMWGRRGEGGGGRRGKNSPWGLLVVVVELVGAQILSGTKTSTVHYTLNNKTGGGQAYVKKYKLGHSQEIYPNIYQ